MKQLLIALLLALAAASNTSARDTIVHVTLADVLALPEAQRQLDGSVRFYLAGQQTPKILKRLGNGVSNRKTNGVGKSDEFGCKWAALSALIALQQSAKQQGANAVVDIVSYYKRNEARDAHTIECHAGNIMIGVALKGSYAQTQD